MGDVIGNVADIPSSIDVMPALGVLRGGICGDAVGRCRLGGGRSLVSVAIVVFVLVARGSGFVSDDWVLFRTFMSAGNWGWSGGRWARGGGVGSRSQVPWCLLRQKWQW